MAGTKGSSGGPRKPRNSRTLNPVAKIQASFTDSAERIGTDAAIYGLILIGGIVALTAGQPVIYTAIFVGVAVAGWIALRASTAYLDRQNQKFELDKLRAKEGESIIRKASRPKLPSPTKQITHQPNEPRDDGSR